MFSDVQQSLIKTGKLRSFILNYEGSDLSKKEQDYAHQAFNNLFLVYKYDEQLDSIIVKRRNRERYGQRIHLVAKMQTNRYQGIYSA